MVTSVPFYQAGILFYPSWKPGWPANGAAVDFCHAWEAIWEKNSRPGHATCLQVSAPFLESLVDVIAAKSKGRRFNTSAVSLGVPSTGFVAVLSLLNICKELNLYGFEMCRQDEGHQISRLDSAVCGDIQTGRCAPQSTVEASTRTAYCRYYPTPRPTSGTLPVTGHAFEAEHAVMQDLEACGLLRRWA